MITTTLLIPHENLLKPRSPNINIYTYTPTPIYRERECFPLEKKSITLDLYNFEKGRLVHEIYNTLFLDTCSCIRIRNIYIRIRGSYVGQLRRSRHHRYNHVAHF